MNRRSSLRSIALFAPLFVVAACGNSSPPVTTPATTPSADTTASATTSATSAPADSPAPSASAATPPPSPKAVTASDVAAACTTTATYDKKEPNKITFNVKNTSDREVKMCWLVFYAYDKSGTQLARKELPYNYAIAPGASDGQPYEFVDLAKQIGGKTVATIETVIMAAKFTDGGELRDESLAPPKRPRAAKK